MTQSAQPKGDTQKIWSPPKKPIQGKWEWWYKHASALIPLFSILVLAAGCGIVAILQDPKSVEFKVMIKLAQGFTALLITDLTLIVMVVKFCAQKQQNKD